MPEEPDVIEAPSLPISTNQGLFLTSLLGFGFFIGGMSSSFVSKGEIALFLAVAIVPILAIIFRLLGD